MAEKTTDVPGGREARHRSLIYGSNSRFRAEDSGVAGDGGRTVERRAAVPAEMTGLYTNEALAFVAANRERAFFLDRARAMPHLPFDASPEFKGKSARGLRLFH